MFVIGVEAKQHSSMIKFPSSLMAIILLVCMACMVLCIPYVDAYADLHYPAVYSSMQYVHMWSCIFILRLSFLAAFTGSLVEHSWERDLHDSSFYLCICHWFFAEVCARYLIWDTGIAGTISPYTQALPIMFIFAITLSFCVFFIKEKIIYRLLIKTFE
jgi:hypothetical protein